MLIGNTQSWCTQSSPKNKDIKHTPHFQRMKGRDRAGCKSAREGGRRRGCTSVGKWWWGKIGAHSESGKREVEIEGRRHTVRRRKIRLQCFSAGALHLSLGSSTRDGLASASTVFISDADASSDTSTRTHMHSNTHALPFWNERGSLFGAPIVSYLL